MKPATKPPGRPVPACAHAPPDNIAQAAPVRHARAGRESFGLFILGTPLRRPAIAAPSQHPALPGTETLLRNVLARPDARHRRRWPSCHLPTAIGTRSP